MATPPPTPPSPPADAETPDGGNPAQASPPPVAPKPGRKAIRATDTSGEIAADDKSASPSTKRRPNTPRRARPSAGAAPTPRARTAKRPSADRRAVQRRPNRPGLSIASTPTVQPVDVTATDPAARKGGRWLKTVAGGIGAVAAGAALLSLRSSSRRKAHQADGRDSSRSFEAGIADEGTIPDKPADV